MQRLLLALSRHLLERPHVVLMATLLPAVALAILGLMTPMDMSFTGIMDRENPEIARYFKTSKELSLGGTLLLLVEGEEARLDPAIAALREALLALDSIKTVDAELSLASLQTRAPFIVDRAVFDDWLGLATRPEDAAGAQRLIAALTELQRALSQGTRKGLRLVEVVMKEDPLDLAAGGGEFSKIEVATNIVLGRHGVEGSYTGLPAISAQDQAKTLGRVQFLTPFSLLAVLLLLRLMERRLIRVLLVGLPLALAGGATLGIVGLITGGLTLMESFFGLTIFGLGVDFAILLIVRLREERCAGRSFDEALTRTITNAGPGIIAGAVTTAGAFAIVAFAPDPTALHLGLSGAIGVSLCVVMMLTTLPATWVLVARVMPEPQPPVPAPGASMFGRISASAVRHPVIHVAVAAAVVVLGIAGASRFHFETDLERVFNRKVPALRTAERVQDLFGMNSGPWIVPVTGMDEARRVTTELAAHPLFARVDSIARLIPADVDERARLLSTAVQDIQSQAAVYRGLRPLVSDSEATALAGIAALVDGLDEARRAGPVTIASLPPSIARRLIAPDGRFIVAGYVKQPSMDGVRAHDERVAAQAIHPDATALGALLEAMMAGERPWAWPVFLAILGFVAIVLVVDMRRPRLVFLALVPVVVGVSSAFGALCWAGVSFNVLTTLVIPLVIGLGVDSGIHMVHRLREQADAPIADAATAMGRAMFFNTVTTCVGFSMLLFTDHAGMESMAFVMLVGLPACLIGALSTVPALATLWPDATPWPSASPRSP